MNETPTPLPGSDATPEHSGQSRRPWLELKDVMVRDVLTISADSTVVDAAERMAAKKVSCILMTDACGKVSGILTERDILRKVVALRKDPASTRIEEVMNKAIIRIPPSSSIPDASKLMEEKGIRHLAVCEGAALCGIVTQTDILHAVRRKLEHEEERNRHWLEAAPNAIFAIDLDGLVTYANPAFCKLLEVENPKHLMHYPFLPERFWPANEERQRFFEELKSRGGIEIKEMALKTAREHRIDVTLFTTFTKDTHGEVDGYLGMLYDVTDKKELVLLRRAEEALRERNEVLQKMNDIKTEVVSLVSHELKAPLTITREGIQLVLSEALGPVNERQRRILNMGVGAVDRLVRLIHDLLDIAKIEAGKMALRKEKIDMKDLTAEILDAFHLPAEAKKITLERKILCHDTRVEADRDRIVQVLTNLMGNAIKFTKAGRITIYISREEHELECCVEDTGVGIAEEQLPRVFEKFEQFSDAYELKQKGTGLGLSISKAIVELHGGRIWVESKPLKGSRFFFTLPLGA